MISWSLMINVITCIGYYSGEWNVAIGDVVVFGGGVYRVDGIDLKDYELYLYPLIEEGKTVHVVEEEC